MITINARGWPQFLAAFGILRRAGVEPVAVGGNEMRVPNDTDRGVLRAVAATGAVVHADLTEPVTKVAEPATEPSDAETQPDAPPEPVPDELVPDLDAPPPSNEDATNAADKPPAAPVKRTPRKATRTRRTRTTAEE